MQWACESGYLGLSPVESFQKAKEYVFYTSAFQNPIS